MIAEWIVTQARSCPTSCGNSARNFSGSVTCSTGDDADCTDPKPATPTRSCGKTADCPTYTGTWIKGSCPSGCGQSRGWKTVSVSCSGGNCDPSAKPSTRRWCQATPPCVVNCQVSGWSSWTDIGDGNWGSCSADCGGGTQTKSQRRTRTITTQPQNGGRACPHLRETQSVSQSCNTHNCPVDCQVGSWGDWKTTLGNCSAKCDGGTQTKKQERKRPIVVQPQHGGQACPALTETLLGSQACNTQACPCGIDLYKKDGSCVSVGNGRYSPSNNDSRYNCTGKPANSSWTSSGGGSNNCSWSCDDDYPWNGSRCEITQILCENSLPDDASWLTGHGQFKPKCSWRCNANFVQVGNSCEPIVNCQWSAWSSWSSWGSCSKSCGGGVKTKTQERTRSITTQPENGGEPCPALKETRTQKQSCNTQACLRLYECNGYGSWIKRGSCSVSDDCDHYHVIGDTCCSPSKPYGPCQNGPVDGW